MLMPSASSKTKGTSSAVGLVSKSVNFSLIHSFVQSCKYLYTRYFLVTFASGIYLGFWGWVSKQASCQFCIASPILRL
jgi:hypothetical protein